MLEQEKMIERHQHKTEETKEHNEEIQTEQANSKTENQEDIEEGTGNIIGDENNIYREELNEEQ